jgi:hypothetical protein
VFVHLDGQELIVKLLLFHVMELTKTHQRFVIQMELVPQQMFVLALTPLDGQEMLAQLLCVTTFWQRTQQQFVQVMVLVVLQIPVLALLDTQEQIVKSSHVLE